MVVLQLFHQTNLGLLFNRLMGGTVFTNAEGVMCPDELHGQFHQRRKAGCRLDVVAEDEERTAGSNHTTMQGHTVDDGGHGQFRYTSVQECTLEVMCLEGTAHLQESVCFIAIGQVGRRNNHVLNLTGEGSKHVGRCRTCGDAGLVLDGSIIHLWRFAVDEILQALHRLGVLLCPCINLLLAFGNQFPLLLSALRIELSHFGEYDPRILGITAQVFNGFAVVGTRFAQRVAVGAAFAFKVLALGSNGAAAHDGAADDDGGAFCLG